MNPLSSASADLLALDTSGARKLAEKWGITLHQFRVYSLLICGLTQHQVAARLGTWQGKISECLSRAIERNPNLPPIRYTRGRPRKPR